MDSRRTSTLRAALCAAFLCIAAVSPPANAQAPGSNWAGMPLTDAIERLRGEGLIIVFTSRIVSAAMRVGTEPSSHEPELILLEILEPHGLTANEGSPGVFVIVVRADRFDLTGVARSHAGGEPVSGAEIRVHGTASHSTHSGFDGAFRLADLDAGSYVLEIRSFGFLTMQQSVDLEEDDVDLGIIELAHSPAVHEEIIVQPSELRLLETEPSAPLSITREQIDRLPHLGGDFLRTASLLPGAAANDITAQFNIHGGRRDEVQIVLDGQELYEAFHLKDYDNALSIIGDENLGLAKLSTGAFPASYGDRMSGVLDLTTVAPTTPLATKLTASVTSLSVLNSGRFRDRLGGWLVSGRVSSPFIPSDVIGTARPSFWDAFAKGEVELTARQTLTARLLGAGDRLTEIEETETGIKDFDTEYNSLYAWIIHQAIVGGRSLARSSLSWSSIDRDRRGFENDDEFTFDIRDLRDLEVAGVNTAWDVQVGSRHVLRFGADVRHFDAGYDYLSVLEELEEDERRLTPSDSEEFEFVDEFDGEHIGVWASDRFSPIEPLTLEVGLRFDKHSLTDDSLTSPRINAAWRLGEGTVLRGSWGIFHQTQRPYELQVEDHETRFFEPEKSEHRVLGFERLFSGGRSFRALRIEAYSRRVSNPRQRFENLIEPINKFPEIEPDRVLVEPEEGRADGVETLVRGVAGSRIDWGLMYAWARSEDFIEDEWRPRRTHQRHTIAADCNYRFTDRWNLNFAFRFHTGWPTTGILAKENEDGEFELAFGPYNGERFPAYHRLDARLTRDWITRRGRITIYLDVQNLYDRENVAGFDASVHDDTGELEIETEHWPGILPSLGVSWQF